MKCHNCHKPIERNTKFCPHCGHKKRFINPSTIAMLILSVFLFIILYNMVPLPKELTSFENTNQSTEQTTKKVEDNKKVQLVEAAQDTVYTIYTEDNQGSAFLYDENGSIVTNAHVVEGSLTATIKTKDGNEYIGEVIGYSNKIDIALISVPELNGQTPFSLEKEKDSKVGEEVIALGTPLGLENTATFGYLTGVNRTFNIPPHTFNDVYQISAPIEPGNSGGPLVSLDQEKIIAINSAKSIDAENIAFSIPLHQIVPLVEDWIESPLSDGDITALFYDEDGNYHYDFLWSLFDDYYFDDGDFLYDEDYHHYWLYDDELELWEQYYDAPYFDEWDEYDSQYWDGIEDYDEYDWEIDEDWDSWDEYDYDEFDEDYDDEYDYDEFDEDWDWDDDYDDEYDSYFDSDWDDEFYDWEDYGDFYDEDE